MAGRPKRRAALEVLWRLARENEDESPLDYAVDYIASGKSLVTLAAEVSVRMPNHWTISREVIRSLLHEFPDAKDRLESARKEAAHALVETSAVELADPMDLIQTDLDLKKATARESLRRFQATAYNREAFGPKGNDTNINLNLGSIMLAALRASPQNMEVAGGKIELLPSEVDS